VSNVFFTADTHFSHSANKLGYGGIIFHANRPFRNIKEHDEALISNWNNDVKSGDHVWILGDFCWKEHNKFIHRLNGKKYLVLGSHDKMSQDTLRLFAEVHGGAVTRLFNGTPFILSHCAFRVWERSHYGSINLYGHSHGRLPEYNDKLQMDVGVDSWNYRVVPLELILMVMATRNYKEGNGLTQEELNARVKELADRNAAIRKHYETPISLTPDEKQQQEVANGTKKHR